jgi:TrmH family RNA methyltransferase
MTAIRFVLLSPAIPENVGAAARALKNFEWSDWAIVQPQFEEWEPARRMAVHAGDLLDSVKRSDSLAASVSDCVWVVGTSSRRRRGQRSLSPREFAAQAIERSAQGPVALVFGEERSGLTNDELDLCHDVSTVPTGAEQPSINLAQALLLYAYECRMAAFERAGRRGPTLPVAASEHELRMLEGALVETLETGAFLHTGNRRVMKELLAPLVRSRLSRHEFQMWISALKSLGKRLSASINKP